MAFSEKFRWAWFVCILLLVGFLANSISGYWVSRERVRNTITESSLPLTSDNVYSEIQRDLLQPVFISSLMANDTFLKDWVIKGEDHAEAIIKYLNEIKLKYGTVSSFFVSDSTLNYYYPGGILKNVSEEDSRDGWYYRVRNMVGPFEINVDPDMANNDEMTIFINYRVFDYQGQFLGATGVGLTVNSVNQLLADYETRFQRHIYFADSTGKIVLRPGNSPFLAKESIEEIEGISPIKDKILQKSSSKLEYKREGKLRFLNSRYVKELGWHLIVEQSEDRMLLPFRRQLRDNILVAMVITVIVAWICLTTINRYHRRLEARNDKLSRLLSENNSQKEELEKASNDQKNANQLLSELNREKDEMLSLVAHDLRNPLNGILGVCDLALEEPQCEPCHDYFLTMQESGNQMNSLIQNLLDASQAESLQGENLKEIQMKTLLEPHRLEATRKHVTLDIGADFDSHSDPLIRTNPEWAKACINNVIGNAIKYTPSYGTVALHIDRSESGNTLDLVCEDNGPGIRDEEKELLFQKFVRLSAKPTGGESSTGLGLYLVKRMCDRMGVEINVASKFGQGSKFTLKFPIV